MVSRVACIESEQESTYICSDLDSVSCGNGTQSREKILSEDLSEIVDLMNRVEQLKRERSILWLQEFMDWIVHASKNSADGGNFNATMLHPEKQNYKKSGKSKRHLIESSRRISKSIQASGDVSRLSVIESDGSFADTSTGMHENGYFDHISTPPGITGGFSLPGLRRTDRKQEYRKKYLHDETNSGSMQAKSAHHGIFSVLGGNKMLENASVSHLSTTDTIKESNSSSAYPGSPPHYQNDLLHRRLNLVEEILQLSAESYSVASSDSDTSCTEDDCCEAGLSDLENHNRGVEGHSSSHPFEEDYYENQNKISHLSENDICFIDSCAEQTFSTTKIIDTDQATQFPVT